jgi:hypothetical protein
VISSWAAQNCRGENISTVGIDGDFLSGFDIAGANEYLLALKILIILIVVLTIGWKIQLKSASRC